MPDPFNNPFNEKPIKERTLHIAPGELPLVPQIGEKTSPADVQRLFADVDILLERASTTSDLIENEALRFDIPIGPDDNEVRAAHRRLGGDGHRITFEQFKSAVNEIQQARNDVSEIPVSTSSWTNSKELIRKRYDRGLGQDSSIIMALSSIVGTSSMLLWALSGLIGGFDAQTDRTIVGGKAPPATEEPGILRKIATSILMAQFLLGLTDAAMIELANLQGIRDIPGVDIDIIIKDSSSLRESDAFKAFVAENSHGDSHVIVSHSTAYIADHISEGLESWWGYLTASEVSQDAQLLSGQAHVFIKDGTTLPDKHTDYIRKRISSGNKELNRIGSTFSRRMSADDRCCITRFLSHVNGDGLESLRRMLLYARSFLITSTRNSYDAYFRLVNHPWRAINDSVLSVVDRLFDKAVVDALDVFGGDSTVLQILRACTPLQELLETVILTVESLRDSFRSILANGNTLLNQKAESLLQGWNNTAQIRRIDELISALDAVLDLGTNLSETDMIAAANIIDGVLWSMDLPGFKGTEATELTQDILDNCKALGDWDALKERLSGK